MTSTWLANHRDPRWVGLLPSTEATEFHRALPGYEPTPLVELPQIARSLDVGRVFAKDESRRLGLPAFKGLGASWAIRKLLDRIGTAAAITVVTATDGNHGRAVARWALHFGQRACVVVPDGVHPAALAAIRSEGADVVEVEGSYDDAVQLAARVARQADHVLVQDTAWPGYEEIPGWIVEGYETMFAEIDEQLSERGAGQPDLIVVPTGVGSLLQAALVHHRAPGASGAAVVSVEPDSAACVYASLAAGRPVSVPTRFTTMAGLNCGTMSTLAWPLVSAGVDGALVTDDAATGRAVEVLKASGLDAGPCGAATLAVSGISRREMGAFRRHVRLHEDSTVVLLVTEGSAANPHLAS